MVDSEKLLKLAKNGQVDELVQQIEGEDIDENVCTTYQWLIISKDFGFKEAEELSDSIMEAYLSRYGDETIAMLHFEIGRWYLLGENKLSKNLEKAKENFEYANNMQIREIVDIEDELINIKKELNDNELKVFEKCFK